MYIFVELGYSYWWKFWWCSNIS